MLTYNINKRAEMDKTDDFTFNPEEEPVYSNTWDIVSKIMPKLYLGSSINTKDELEYIKKLGINVMVDLTLNQQVADTIVNDFYLKIPVEEGEALTLEQMKIGSDFIKMCMDSGHKVFVHCRTGRHRSSTLVAAYLIRYESASTEDAVKFIHSKRNAAKPNTEQTARLMMFEDVISGKKFRY